MKSKSQTQSGMVVVLVILTVVQPSKPSVTTAETLDQDGYYSLPGLVEETYRQLGDINIGAIVMVTTVSKTNPAGACSKEVNKPMRAFEHSEAIAFAVDKINKNPDILPNTTLGFVIRGSCTGVGPAIARSLSFLPRTRKESNMTHVCSVQGEALSKMCTQDNDVVGIVPPGWSSHASPVSSLYAVAQIPMVGTTETSDELSNKDKHPYFFRVVPPDVYQVQAILNFVSSNGWSYISVLYEDGSYGQTAFDNLQKSVGKYGICIATSHRLFHSTDYKEVVSDLLKHSRARAVVLFAMGRTFQPILQAVVDKNATGHFIWIGGNGLRTYQGHIYKGLKTDPAVGAFVFEFYNTYVSDFYDYLRQQKVNTSNNPWIKTVWEYFFDCSFDMGTCDRNVDILQSGKYQPLTSTPYKIDAVLTFAQAVHDLLSERCPAARGLEARACITGKLLREYLKNTSLEGYLGPIQFDKNQEVKGRYIISQFEHIDSSFSDKPVSGEKRLLPKKMRIYDISSNRIHYFNESVSWSHLNRLGRIFPITKDSLPLEIPESVCSGPCGLGEFKIVKEVSCCWECRRCRDNERLVDGNTSCEVCPPFTWPDPLSAFTTCASIPLTFPSMGDTIPLALISITSFVLIVYLSTFITYFIYRNERVIKASSRELSVIQLVAILGGYVNVLLFQTKPTTITCSAIFFLFCMSFALLYSPLLVKTIRIVRIFKSVKSNQHRLRFISPESQLFITGLLVSVQVALCIAVYILFSPGAHMTQPIWSEKLVELSCDLTLPGLTSFLGYNLVLVSMCAIFAFKVRKLPDNFNESSFISMCVATTLLIWLAFIPTYFTASREFIRVFLLSTALLLNHTVALIFLYLPKIYAAIYLVPESGTGNLANKKP